MLQMVVLGDVALEMPIALDRLPPDASVFFELRHFKQREKKVHSVNIQ
jgi:hypothetical protein